MPIISTTQNQNSILNSNLMLAQDFVLEPNVQKQIVGAYPDQYDLDFFNRLGRVQKSVNEPEIHHEDVRLLDAPVIDSVAATGTLDDTESGRTNVATDIEITLVTASHTGASNQFSFPRVNQIIEFQNGRQGRIVAKDTSTDGAHVIGVIRTNGAALVVGDAPAGQRFILPSNAFSEGAFGQRESLTSGRVTVQTLFQKIKEVYKATGKATEIQTYTMAHPKTGQVTKYHYVYDLLQTSYRFQAAISYACLLQQASTANHIDPANNGQPVETTEGLIPQMLDNGNYYPTGGGSVTIGDWFGIGDILRDEHATGDYLVMQGSVMESRSNSLYTEWSRNGGMQHDNPTRGEMDLNLKCITPFNSFKFYFADQPLLNHNEMAGASGFPYRGYGLVLPLAGMKDAATGKMGKSFELMYREPIGGTKRELAPGANQMGVKAYETGARAGIPTSDEDVYRVDLEVTVGMKTMGINRSVVIDAN